MNTEATEEFQWIFDDDVVVTPIDPTEPLDSIYRQDSASASLPHLAQNDEDAWTSPSHSAQDFLVEEAADAESRSNGTQAWPPAAARSAQNSLAPMYAVSEPYLGTAAFPPVPEPPVNTAPRPVTIVWGFVIMAIGVLAISFAAGAAVDLGLVLIWLPAICGIALISAAIFAAVKKSSAW